MILNQLSCVVGIIVAYILSYNKINKRRIVILTAVAIVNMLINIFLEEELDFAKTIICIAITVIGVICIIFFNLSIKPFGRKKLNKKIEIFTKRANANLDLKMMTGDLTFFGDISEMDNNFQVEQLRKLKFKKIKIIAKRPANNQEKIRIGKLFYLLSQSSIEIKFYVTDSYPDLRLRFRIISLGDGSTAILNIFKFKTEKEYRIEELGFSSDPVQKKRHNTLEKLWDMYWNSLAYDEEIIKECKGQYNSYENRGEISCQNIPDFLM